MLNIESLVFESKSVSVTLTQRVECGSPECLV